MPTNSERVRLWGGRSEVIGAGSKWRFAGFGFGPYYEYYPYACNDYYDDGRCYVVRRSVMTHYGWRVRPVQACGTYAHWKDPPPQPGGFVLRGMPAPI
jgi:hypothetical protein